MAADIDAQNFFFQSQKHLFVILSHIRQLYLIAALFFLTYQIKQRQLSCQIGLFILVNGIHHLTIDAHKLFSGRPEAVQSTCFNKVFYQTLVHILTSVRHSGNKIL